MFKKIVLSLVLVLGLTSLAFAGVKEGNDLSNAGKYIEAEAEYRASLPTLKGGDASGAQLQIGYCLACQGKFAEAIVEYQKVITMAGVHPHHLSNAYLHIGSSFKRLGKKEEAQNAFKETLKVKNGYLAHLKVALGELDKVSLGKEVYLQLLNEVLLNIPAPTKEELETPAGKAKLDLITFIKSEQVKLK